MFPSKIIQTFDTHLVYSEIQSRFQYDKSDLNQVSYHSHQKIYQVLLSYVCPQYICNNSKKLREDLLPRECFGFAELSNYLICKLSSRNMSGNK